MIVTATNPSGEIVHFDSVPHQYYTDNGIILTSATRFINSFFPKFDAITVSEKYAAKRNLDPSEVRKMWKEKGAQASHLGTQVHEYAQSLFEQKDYSFTDGDITKRRVGLCKAVDQAYNLLINKYKFIQAEKIVFSTALNIAGTIDLLMRDEVNHKIIILDWKTNTEIKQSNFWQNALSPICHLEDCAFNKYQLQLSLYQYILKTENYFPGYDYKMALIHLEQYKVNWIVVDNLESEIIDMLQWV